jgi:hypothetical protein
MANHETAEATELLLVDNVVRDPALLAHVRHFPPEPPSPNRMPEGFAFPRYAHTRPGRVERWRVNP